MSRSPYRLSLLGALVWAVTLGAVVIQSSAAPPRPRIDYIPEFGRPIRVPESVTLTHVEPSVVLAGERRSLTFPFTLCRAIKPGQALKLELWSGRNCKGSFGPVQTDDPSKRRYLAARLEDGTKLACKGQHGKRSYTADIEVPAKGLAKGTTVIVTLGDPKDDATGASMPNTRMIDKFVVLYCPHHAMAPGATKPPTGPKWGLKMQKTMVGVCLMHVMGNRIHHLRAYVPSQCKPGEKIDVLVRPEDSFSNLSCQALKGVEVWLGDKRLPATVRRVKDSTCSVATVAVPSEGVHRLKVVGTACGKSCLTNPTRCSAAPPAYNRYWGMLHGHTEMSDGTGTLDYYFRQMRDEGAIDFAASSDHDHDYETPDSYWPIICETVKRWNEPGRFVTILGYEWAKWERNGDGDRNVYYLKDDQPFIRSEPDDCPDPPDLHKALKRRKAIVIPHHPGGDGNHCDYMDHDPYHERLIEIHQVRGCYECSAEDGNPLIAKPDRKGGQLVAKGFVQRALALGWRAGFTANGDDHRGTAGTDKPARVTDDGKIIYAGGMAVLAKERTREAIFDGLWNRRVVATSGPRMLLDVTLNGHLIGSILSAKTEPELAKRRTIKVDFHGMAPVARIDIIRNNEVVHTTQQSSFTWEDTTPLTDALLPPAKHCSHPFCFYYVRAVQTDHQAAWASPIWIDP